MNCDFGSYAEALYGADDLASAFAIFENQIQQLGFDGALYTYIPEAILYADDREKPVYQVSDTYVPDYLAHYQDARYDRADPLIKAVTEGISTPIDWSGEILETYMSQDSKSREVIDESRCYGVRHGITVPLKSDTQGIAGASFIMTDSRGHETDQQRRIRELQVVTRLYHDLVVANTGFVSGFIRPMFGNLNDLELRFLAGLASGKTLKELAIELSRSRKYLEQVLLRIRIKVSGMDADGKARITRDQLLYYAGLFNIIVQVEQLGRS